MRKINEEKAIIYSLWEINFSFYKVLGDELSLIWVIISLPNMQGNIDM